jgi:DnaJ family protein C protein 9
MYGDGKSEEKDSKGKRGGKEAGSSSSAKRSRADDEEDLSGLAAMIARRQSSRETAMDALFEKYSKPQVKGKKKK